MIDDERLIDLLEQWEDLRRRGLTASAEELAEGDAELAKRLASAIEELKNADWMLQAPPTAQRNSVTQGINSKKSSELHAENPLGPYELLELLGKGGMGAVFKARHTRLNKFVAIKVLPEHLTRNAEAVTRFDREIRAVGVLEHPNIVRAMDADEHKGIHYLVMEYVEGQDLHSFVRQNGPLKTSEACRLIRDAALALDYAHKNGLVHRDIKPSNLLITKAGQLKVLDLGLARLIGESDSESGLTNTGASLGTPDYMAPEQWEDSRSVDHRTDLYALGCTLYFLLVGKAPYSIDQYRTVIGKMTAHAVGDIPRLRDAKKDVPPALDALYQKLLAKSAEKRVQTAADLATRIEPFCIAEIPKVDGEVIPPRSPQLKASRYWWLAIACILLVGVVAVAASTQFEKYASVFHANNDQLPSERSTENEQREGKPSPGPSEKNKAALASPSGNVPKSLVTEEGWFDLFPLLSPQTMAAPGGAFYKEGGTIRNRPFTRSADKGRWQAIHPPLWINSNDWEVELDVTLDSPGRVNIDLPVSNGVIPVSVGTDEPNAPFYLKVGIGKKTKVRVHFTHVLPQVKVIAAVDNEPLLNWQGPASQRIFRDGREENQFCLGVFGEGNVAIHGLRLKALAGNLEVDRYISNKTSLPSFVSRRPLLGGCVPKPGLTQDGSRWQIYSREPIQPNRTDWGHASNQIAVSELNGGLVRLYDAESLQLSQILAGHSKYLNGLAWSPQGTSLLSISADHTGKIWNFGKSAPPQNLLGNKGLLSAAWSSKGDRVYANEYYGENAIYCWNREGVELGRILLSSPIAALTVSPDADQVFATMMSMDAMVKTTSDLEKPTSIPALTNRKALSVHPSGDYLAVGRLGNTEEALVAIWSVREEKIVAELKTHILLEPYFLRFSPDGKYLGFGTQSNWVGVWEWQSNKTIAEFHTGGGASSSGAWNRDGNQLLYIVDNNPLWRLDLKNNLERKKILGKGTSFSFFSPDGKYVALHHISDGSYQVVDLSRLTNVAIFEPPASQRYRPVTAWDPEGKKILLITNESQTGCFVDVADQGRRDEMEKKVCGFNGVDPISHLASSRNGKTIATMDHKSIHIWDAVGDRRHTIAADKGRDTIAVNDNGSLVAVSYWGEDSTLLIWNANTGKLQCEVTGAPPRIYQLLWVGNEELFGVTTDGWVYQWNVSQEDATEVRKFQGQTIVGASDPQKAPWMLVKNEDESVGLRRLDSEVELPLLDFPKFAAPRGGFTPKNNLDEITLDFRDDILRTWNTKTGALLRIVAILPNRELIQLDPRGRIQKQTPNAEKEYVYAIEEEEGGLTLHSPEEFRLRKQNSVPVN